MALYLAQEVINNAFTDLSSIEHTNGDILNGSISNAPAGAKKPSSHRKRKHINATGSLQEHDQGGGLGLEVPKNCPLTPISLRIAALETLEALVTVVCMCLSNFIIKIAICFFINLSLPSVVILVHNLCCNFRVRWKRIRTIFNVTL